MRQRFTYKRALLGGVVHLEVSDEEAVLLNDGESILHKLSLARATSARFLDQTIDGTRSIFLDIEAPEGPFHVGLSGSDLDAATSANARQFLSGLVLLLDKLHRAAPSLRVKLGPSRGSRWVMFSIGVFAILAAVIIAALAIGSGFDGEKLWGGLFMCLILALFGLPIVLSNRPGTALPKLEPGTLSKVYARMGGLH
jgi:hypothetical protein